MKKSTKSSERRKFIRLPVEIRVKYKTLKEIIDTSGMKPAKVKNLSSGGILFHSGKKLSKDDTLQLKLDFARGKSKYDLAAIGQVVRCSALKNGQYTIGVRFLEIYSDDLNLLKGYIEKKVMKSDK